MMQIVFLGDGPRDAQVIPSIVEKVIPSARASSFRSWKDIRLNRGSGYGRKLKLAISEAKADRLDGVVAVVDRDRDKSHDKLTRLRNARDQHANDPTNPPIRVALGEASPHTEAWLLDDPKAVREAYHLPVESTIPTVKKSNYPKDDLSRLYDECPRDEPEFLLLTEIARLLDEKRCNHHKLTGLSDFLADVRSAFLATSDD